MLASPSKPLCNICLDGTLPGYHFHPGFGSGANSWVIQLEGGGWCNTIRSCVFRKTTRRGSSKFMEKQLPFTGILSNKAEENPDFFNWNRVKVRYCDGASFSGDSQDEAAQLQFRGQKIWQAAMEELMSKGMKQANQALLSGCSAGGLASIIHCDEFRTLFPTSTKVKCLSDAGLFLDAVDVSGVRTLRNLFGGVVKLQPAINFLVTGSAKKSAKKLSQPIGPNFGIFYLFIYFKWHACFFPQNLVNHVETPLFLLNAAYDAWQVQESLVPSSADPHGSWNDCKHNRANCNSSQILFFQDFRNQMLNYIKGFSGESQTGLFINSCFAHCQTELQDTWFADDSPVIGHTPIAIAVGDWYFDRKTVKAIDCAYPCDKTCHDLGFKAGRSTVVDYQSPSGDDTSTTTMTYSSSTRLTYSAGLYMLSILSLITHS
ncbi:hypothetical protein ACSQ67_002000 [Phaseolus vulgaris]